MQQRNKGRLKEAFATAEEWWLFHLSLAHSVNKYSIRFLSLLPIRSVQASYVTHFFKSIYLIGEDSENIAFCRIENKF